MSRIITFSDQISNNWKWRLAVSAFLIAVVLFPVLSGLKIWRADATELFIPQLAFYKQALSKNESLYWNPYLAVGFPNFVSTFNPIHPAVLLLNFFSPITVHYWILFFILSLALFLTVSFLKEIEINSAGAWMGGLSYLLAGLWYTQNIVIGLALLVQAALFWGIIRISKVSGFWPAIPYIIFGALGVGLAWLSIGYWYNLYFFVTALLLVLFLRRFWGASFKRVLMSYVAIWSFGTLIGLLQLIPAYIITQFSGRGAGFDSAGAAGYTIGIKELLNFFHLTPDRGLDAYLYLGIVPLLFLVFSFYSRNSFAKFFRWIFLIGLLMAFRGSPVFWLIHQLPLFNYFQGAARFLILSNFASAVLIGLGTEQLLYFLKEAKSRFADKVFYGGALVVVAVLLVTILVNRQAFYSGLIAGLILLAAYLIWKKFAHKPILLPFLLLLTTADFILTFYLFNKPLIIPRSVYEKLPATADFFEENPGRIFPLFVEDWDDTYFYQLLNKSIPPSEEDAPYVFDLQFETYFPNLALLNSVETLEINDPLLNVDLGKFLALIGTRQLVTTGGEEKLNKLYVSGKDSTGEILDISVVERLKIFKDRLPLASFLGVRYVLSPFRLDGLGHILKTEAYTPLYIMGGSDAPPMPVYIFSNPTAKPLAYFTKVAAFKSDPADIYQSFKASGFKDIFVECENCPSKSFNGDGEIFLDKKENGQVKLRTVSDEEQFMVLTQNYLPGWRALVDGQEVPMYKVNTVFPGIFVPPGEHTIKFEYDYWSLFNPKWLLSKK